MVDNEIVSFASSNGGQITSVLPLLDHLSRAHPDTPADELVGQVDAAFDRLYRAGRAWFAGHRWLSEQPSTVAGFLQGRVAELRYDTTTRTWSWSDTAWTENITVR
jgi:hypothetical protein